MTDMTPTPTRAPIIVELGEKQFANLKGAIVGFGNPHGPMATMPSDTQQIVVWNDGFLGQAPCICDIQGIGQLWPVLIWRRKKPARYCLKFGEFEAPSHFVTREEYLAVQQQLEFSSTEPIAFDTDFIKGTVE